MHTTAAQIFDAMRQIVEAPGYPLLTSYKDDFYKHDHRCLLEGWGAKSRAIWVVTPNGTHFTFIGQHVRQLESVDAFVHCGYSQIEIYLLRPSGIKRITRSEALTEAKIFDFTLNKNEVIDAHGGSIAKMSIHTIGPLSRRTNVHFDPGIAYTGSLSQLVALRNIAIEGSIHELQTLFTAVERITVGDSLLTDKGLIAVATQPSDQLRYVIHSPKGFFSKKRGWSCLSNADQFSDRHNTGINIADASVVTLREARFIVAATAAAQ